MDHKTKTHSNAVRKALAPAEDAVCLEGEQDRPRGTEAEGRERVGTRAVLARPKKQLLRVRRSGTLGGYEICHGGGDDLGSSFDIQCNVH